MPIWGWICSGLAVLAALVVVYAVIDTRRMWRHYREHADEMVGWVVQANTALYSPGGLDRPAQILVAFDARGDEPDPAVAEVARRAAALKGEQPTDPTEVEVARLVNDEDYRPFQRFLLPREFTGGREVYSMHVWVQRAKLPGGVLRHPFVRCLVLRDEPATRPLMVPYRPSDDAHQR
jgi:hypothetical protein